MAKASVEPIHHPPPPREVLADAIGRHAAALENVARVAAAHEAAAETVFRAADALKAAEAQHDEALACEAETLAAQALGEPAGLSVADAEAAVGKATDDLARARATRDALKEREAREAAEAAKAERALQAAVVMVIEAEAPLGKMLRDAQELQRQLIAARLELRWLQRMNCVPADAEIAVRRFLGDTALPTGTGIVETGNFDNHPACEVWLAAAAKLKEDPSAKLPT